jgi:hypothetical protein
MNAQVEIVGNRIWLRTEYHIKRLAEFIPGSSFSDRDGAHWSIPLNMDACALLRERFGEDLEIGPKLWDWAKGIRASEGRAADIRAGRVPLQGAWRKAYPTLWKAVTETRRYQEIGAAWINYGRRVLIGDTVGLGKTVQALAGVLETGIPGPHLIVCPKTAVESVWAPEIRTWLPGMEVITVPEGRAKREAVLDGMVEHARKRSKGSGGPLDDVWVIVHPEMVRTKSWWICGQCGSETAVNSKPKELVCGHDPRKTKTRHDHAFPALFEFPWGSIIADESDKSILRLTGTPTLTRNGMELIREALRPEGILIAQSGTPFRSRPHLLWSTLNWLRPDEYGGFWRWAETLFEMTEGYGGSRIIGSLRGDREQMLYRSLDRVMLRRTREEVAPHLPKRLYVGTKITMASGARVGGYTKATGPEPFGVWLPMDAKQEKAYQQMLKTASATIEGGTLNAIGILAELTRLKQFATSAGRLDEKGEFHPALPSNKFDYLVQLLTELGYPDDPQTKVIIVSQFTQTLDLFRRELGAIFGEQICTSVTGRVTGPARRTAIDAFNDPKDPISLMFLNTKAGGSAITLDAADEMVILDETWIPDDQEQVEGRNDNRRPEEKIVQRRYRYLRSLGSVDQGIAVVNWLRGTTSAEILDGRRGVNIAKEILEVGR